MLSALSQAWASWRTAPGITVLAVVAFAVGTGSATAIFTVINGVLLRPMPYPNSERLVTLYGAKTTEPGTFLLNSVPDLQNATFFYAQFDEQRRTLRYVNAGHNAAYLLRASRGSTDPAWSEIEQLSVGGTVVGMFPEMGYEEGTVELCPGDVLFAFTDGVPEAHNPENEEFGEERLQMLLRQIAHLPVDEISTKISAEMKNWILNAEQYDDLTFIVMKVR